MKARVGILLMKIIFVILFGYPLSELKGQPSYDSKKKIEGIHIYKDHADPLLYYYEPGALVLGKKGNDAPDFQFLDMRYTGTKCYNDQGEKNFMSLVQFGVEMVAVDPSVLRKIKKYLGGFKTKLRPLPIIIQTKMVLSSIENDTKETVEKIGVLEAGSKEGYTNSKSFWTKRIFTTKLNKHESQVLKAQLTEGLLGISMAYAYYTDFKKSSTMEATGSSAIIDSLATAFKDLDIVENKVVRSDAIPIRNEEIPPAYAHIELKCYDFSNKLRPDLYMKIVEIEAESVNKAKRVTVETKFSQKHDDLYTKHVSFPYAVYVDTPMRFRVTEIDISGERRTTEWKDKPECASIIDVTTTGTEQKFKERLVDLEIDSQLFSQDSLQTVTVLFAYTFNNAIKTKELVFEQDDSSLLRRVKMIHDKEVPIFLSIAQKSSNGLVVKREPTIFEEGYLFLTN